MTARRAFEEELESLKLELVKMCRITEDMISDSITALTTKGSA